MKNSIEILDESALLRERISNAMKNAQPTVTLEIIHDAETKILGAHEREEISTDDMKKQTDFLLETNGIVRCQTFLEMREALKKVPWLSEEHREEIVAHENDHFNKAEELGLENILYEIQFLQKPNGEKGIQPGIVLNLPTNISKSEKDEIYRKVVSAPEELSATDLQELENL